MTELAANWEAVPLGDVTLEVATSGSGEPVVLIQTALTADELMPLARQPALAEAYRVVPYHRRGYAGSSAARGAGSIARDAEDCARLMDALGIAQAHIVGLSFSGAVALQLAVSSPERVASLCLIEPPPLHIPSADEFVAANAALQSDYRERGRKVALDRFLTRAIGPDWLRDIEEHLPGGAQQAQRDAETFFATDIPALLGWEFGADDASAITAPVLYVGGTASGPWFGEVHQLVLDWLPQTEDVMIRGADHSLALTHPSEIASALADFLRRHPLPARSASDTRDVPVRSGRLSNDVPTQGEAFHPVASLGGVRVEHIVSSDAPDTALQRQAWDEWVLVLAGEAAVDVDGTPVSLASGEWLLIPAGTPHRVLTAAAGTHWLAVHTGGPHPAEPQSPDPRQ